MTFNLTVDLVVDQDFTERGSNKESDDGVDHVTNEITHGLAGRVLLDLFLHDDLGWLRDGAGLTANQLGLVQGLDFGLDSLLLVQIRGHSRRQTWEEWEPHPVYHCCY